MNLQVDLGYLIVGITTAGIAALGLWLTSKDRKQTAVKDNRADLLDSYEGFNDRITARMNELEEQVAELTRRVSLAERALSRAHLVIQLLIRQIRSLGHEPDLPDHLSLVEELDQS